MKCQFCDYYATFIYTPEFVDGPEDYLSYKTELNVMSKELTVYTEQTRHLNKFKYRGKTILAKIGINYCPWCGRRLEDK